MGIFIVDNDDDQSNVYSHERDDHQKKAKIVIKLMFTM